MVIISYVPLPYVCFSYNIYTVLCNYSTVNFIFCVGYDILFMLFIRLHTGDPNSLVTIVTLSVDESGNQIETFKWTYLAKDHIFSAA